MSIYRQIGGAAFGQTQSELTRGTRIVRYLFQPVTRTSRRGGVGVISSRAGGSLFNFAPANPREIIPFLDANDARVVFKNIRTPCLSWKPYKIRRFFVIAAAAAAKFGFACFREFFKPRVLNANIFRCCPQWIVMIGLEGGTRNGGTTTTSTTATSAARQHAAQAMDYYNSNVLRARTNAGLSSARQQRSVQDPLYRSNSSLELTHHHSDFHHHHHHHHHHHQQQQQQQNHHHHHGGGVGGNTAAYVVDSRAAERPLVSPLLKREYGSHGSIDVIASDRNSAGRTSASENFFALLQDYRPTVLDMIDGNSE